MKKLIALLCALALIFSLAGCTASGKPAAPEAEDIPVEVTPEVRESPDGVVKVFCAAMRAFDFDAMQDCLAIEKDLHESIDLEDGMQTQLFDYLADVAGTLAFEVGDVRTDGDEAKVTVHFDYADVSPVVETALGDYVTKVMEMFSNGDDPDDAKMGELFVEALLERAESDEPDAAETDITFTCVKAEEGWKLADVPDEALNVMTSNISEAFDALNSAEDAD